MIGTYTESLALTLGPSSIRVNAIHPPTSTPTCCRARRCTRRSARPRESHRRGREGDVPVHAGHADAVGRSADISHAVVYLASDESRFVTGQQLRVDAGAGLKLGI
ncbi:SDR family oxidoreductase [Prescottella defluvii]|nr:SDR family oxidoreductase [Prescottella defluvii]